MAKHVKKWPFWPKIAVFDTFRKNVSNKFSKIALKVGKKIVLYDTIVILPKKFDFGAKLDQIRPKNDHFWPKSQFLGHCEKIVPTNFLKLHQK